MSDTFLSMHNLRFLLYEVLNAESLAQYPYFGDHDREVFDLVLDTGLKMGKELLRPCLEEMDKNPPVLEEGTVKVHPVIRTFMKACGEGGWIAAHAPYERGGQQIPNLIMSAFRFIFSAANYSASVFPSLTAGAAHLVDNFGGEELYEAYARKMIAGEWQGTMALTEPQAGSSLGDLTTSAEPTDEGHYLIKGQKIFISLADHDGVDNVVNLLLARIKGAPPGLKGISLFVVPKKRLDEQGELTGNDVTVSGIYHKLGYHGAPLTQLSLGEDGDCRGWLCGEPNKGLRCMFQMMNEARIEVGLGAAAIASAAYHSALDYTRERLQGRNILSRDPESPQIPIIEHADVKRMLLFQRAVVEGSLALILQCAKYVDLQHVLEGEERERCTLLLDLLTPVVKSYPSEMGILSVSSGLQCLGGYGYCDDFPLAQFYRDIRIHAIHEGTTAIQGMDLLGRKIVMKNGQATFLYLEEVEKTIETARAYEPLEPYADKLNDALDRLKTVTGHLTGLAMEGKVELFLADATLYLEFFSIIAIAWQWMLQAIVAQESLSRELGEGEKKFYQGKICTFRYFFDYELPKTMGLAQRLHESDGLTLEMPASCFTD